MCATSLNAQQVSIRVGESLMKITPKQTQTEVRPGWRIVDIQLKDRTTRYLFGRRSNHFTESARPTFLIEPAEDETLVNYVLIQLTEKKQYRKLPHSSLRDNNYLRIEPQHFDIKPQGDSGFICTPREELTRGEYILVCLTQQPLNELGDVLVYPFRVE